MLGIILHKHLRIPYRLHVHDYKRIKGRKKTIVFLHGIGSSGAIWNKLIKRDFDANIISLDLLGFGNSPKTSWQRYDASIQARAINYTLQTLGVFHPVIIVGHSMGALTAVEMAKKYPKRVSHLVLCSPPFYQQLDSAGHARYQPEVLLRKLYAAISSNPVQFAKLTTFASKYKLINEGYDVTSENITTYVAALEGMIMNQTALEDALKLTTPTRIFYGSFDPFVITNHLKRLAKHNSHIEVTSVMAGHEIRGVFLDAVTKELKHLTAN